MRDFVLCLGTASIVKLVFVKSWSVQIKGTGA